MQIEQAFVVLTHVVARIWITPSRKMHGDEPENERALDQRWDKGTRSPRG